SISLRCGEILGLIGPNGAGKTTLLECISGLLPSNGAVCWNGVALPANDRRGVMFYLPDEIVLYPSQTVRQVLTLFSSVYHSDSHWLARTVEALGLDPLLRRQCGQLSKGARQRVELAVALMTPHPVLLIDEPFDGLDLRQARHAMQILRE